MVSKILLDYIQVHTNPKSRNVFWNSTDSNELWNEKKKDTLFKYHNQKKWMRQTCKTAHTYLIETSNHRKWNKTLIIHLPTKICVFNQILFTVTKETCASKLPPLSRELGRRTREFNKKVLPKIIMYLLLKFYVQRRILDMVEHWSRWERSNERHTLIILRCQFWNEEDALE